MVYRGLPSRDCLPCRKRKLRCDLRNGGCGQCERAKLLCHGYRKTRGLTIRDETHSTRQKVLGRTTSTSITNPVTLQVSLDARARHAFFSGYVFGFSRSYDVLAPLYSRASASDHLSASVDAVSLAFMSFQHGDPRMTRLAHERYVIALQRLRYALHISQLSHTDGTLQSVLLLDLYEKLMTRNPQSSTSWMSHIQGAMSLVMSRGNNLSYFGCRLAIRLVVALTASCGTIAARVPDALVALRRELSSYADHTKWEFTALVADLVNLRADYHNSKSTLPFEVAERAREIDTRFADLENTLPPLWMSQRVRCCRRDSLIFGCYYDVYQNHYAAQVRNAIRMMRLLLNDMIRKSIPDDPFEHRSGVIKVIAQIAQNICASVPPFILPGIRPENQIPLSPLQRLQCLTLVAPIYIAGQLSPDDGLRDWAIHVLEYIAELGKIKVAKEVCDILRVTPDADYWTIYAILGCDVFTA